MRKFIIRVVLFSLLLVTLFAIGLFLPATPRSSQSFLYSKINKDFALKTIKERRIILVGGSNLSFGINSEVIHQELELYPINTAVHFSIGLEYMMANTLQYIKKDDIIILSPEYRHFFGDFMYGGNELLRTVADVDVFKIFDLKQNQISNISQHLVKYSLSKFKPSEYFGFKESDVYSINSFNKYGDVNAHWTFKQRQFNAFGAITAKYNQHTIQLIKEFQSNLEKKGAILYITFPSFQGTSYDKSINKIKKVQKELIENNFELLGTPERYRMPDSLMFDTPYHLIKQGVDYRTNLLLEDIKSEIIL